ncbi:nicotinate (nicotinamide) nucleotide adenylyltransferase [Mucisphaera calidilacus]|uniref:Probable nicotinate-nucleotide adenylyltransferase n=1 Tax=Mucisphaera calidilacus TaxID=2527982 RepID=A0A518BX70_9BACT|nr:nicotinate (nicotinamide) nucleotide adenylyltransferase [Mucisphaera calidilacus]QDU71577.1 Nicotinate-nucleotide adenylyltransferase [Mucisphaera calidilacus]
MSRNAQQIIIFGGTFDPPHRAHIQLPDLARRHLHADQVLYLPAGNPPHKTDQTITPAHHRLAMLRAALRDHPWARIDTRELDDTSGNPSYTVNTLEQIRAEQPPTTQLRLLIGSDQALLFHAWREPQRIEQLAEPLVMVRPPLTPDSFLDQLPPADRERWQPRILEVPALDVSSTTIRNAIRHNSAADNLNPDVLNYIREHKLYAD